MNFMITSEILQKLSQGLQLSVTADDLKVQAYVVIAPADLSIVETLIPVSVFESSAQVHVGSVSESGDQADQVLQILENMEPDDVAVYLCEGATAFARTLTVLGAPQTTD